MTETEFIELAEQTLQSLQAAVESACSDWDVDRQGNVLTLQADDGFQIVINKQTPTRQIWLASLKGGHHYELEGEEWVDTCTRQTLKKALESLLTERTGRPVRL